MRVIKPHVTSLLWEAFDRTQLTLLCCGPQQTGHSASHMEYAMAQHSDGPPSTYKTFLIETVVDKLVGLDSGRGNTQLCLPGVVLVVTGLTV